MFTDIRRLLPHEADDLDVILLGHSMGGLMAADVALLQIGTQPKHRILGLVNFDTPFLGLHPHVFSFGIGSLFQKTDETSGNGLADEEQKREFGTVYSDPNFNPPDIPYIPDRNSNPQRRNDARLSERGLIKNGKHHFQKKRAEKKKRDEECGVKSKISSLVAPMKFASGVNNFSELRRRYQRLQDLEDAANSARRLRFVNYYTSSTGRQKVKGTPPVSRPSMPFSNPNLAAEKTTRKNQDLVCTPRTTSFTSSNRESDRDLSESELRKFVLLPSAHWKDDKNLNWLPVTMEGMDEMEAHQSMFFPTGAKYDYLVGDTVALVEQWVQNDLSQRLLQDIK